MADPAATLLALGVEKFNVRRLRGKVVFTVRLGDGAPYSVYLTEADAVLLSAALSAAPARETPECEWHQDEYGDWHSACGLDTTFGPPSTCQNCGGVVGSTYYRAPTGVQP